MSLIDHLPVAEERKVGIGTGREIWKVILEKSTNERTYPQTAPRKGHYKTVLWNKKKNYFKSEDQQ